MMNILKGSNEQEWKYALQFQKQTSAFQFASIRERAKKKKTFYKLGVDNEPLEDTMSYILTSLTLRRRNYFF